MTVGEGTFRRHAPRIVALAVILGLYGLARQPDLTGSERSRLAGRFGFVRHALPEPPGDLSRTVRPVHPSLKTIESWISAVGAAVAINDLDADGLADDVVYVNTRADRVVVAPAPGRAIATSRSRSTPIPCPTTPPRWPRWGAFQAT